MPFEFTQESFSDFGKQILEANGDQATITSLIADMQGTFTDQLGIVAKQAEEMERLTSENQRYQKANMELFLRVGEQAKQKSGESVQPHEEEVEQDVDTYMNNLFKEG